MIFVQYKGTFRANEPHDLEEEGRLQDEMQQLADSTIGSERNKQTFDMRILIGVDALNKKHQNINRGYEVHLFDKGAIIYVNEYIFYPNDYGTSTYISSMIADYTIMQPIKN